MSEASLINNRSNAGTEILNNGNNNRSNAGTEILNNGNNNNSNNNSNRQTKKKRLSYNTPLSNHQQRLRNGYFQKGKQILQIQGTPEEVSEVVKELEESGYKNIQISNQVGNTTQIRFTSPQTKVSKRSNLPSSIVMNGNQSARSASSSGTNLKRRFDNVSDGGSRDKKPTQKKGKKVGKKTRYNKRK
jgi:hypothetical protein